MQCCYTNEYIDELDFDNEFMKDFETKYKDDFICKTWYYNDRKNIIILDKMYKYGFSRTPSGVCVKVDCPTEWESNAEYADKYNRFKQDVEKELIRNVRVDAFTEYIEELISLDFWCNIEEYDNDYNELNDMLEAYVIKQSRKFSNIDKNDITKNGYNKDADLKYWRDCLIITLLNVFDKQDLIKE